MRSSALLFVGLGLAGPSAGPAATLEGPTWRLRALRDPPPFARSADLHAVSVHFAAGGVEGFSGCNRFQGTYTVEGDRLTLGFLASTMKACMEPAMSVEGSFRAAFAGTLRFTFEGDTLRLVSAKGTVLEFAVTPPEVLEGVTYAVLGYNNGKQAVQSPILGTTLTLRFESGVVSGQAGCNTYRGGYTREGARLVLTPAATTRKTCPGDAVMTQELVFLEALWSATTFTLQDGRLELRRGDGALAVYARVGE